MLELPGPTDLQILFGFFAAVLFAAALTYRAVERAHRWRWQEVALPLVSAGDGAYRGAEAPSGHLAAAPLAVRLAAFSSLYLGLLLVPGVVLAALAVLFAREWGLLTLPSLAVAALLWRAGLALLRRDATAAAARARTAGTAALVVNALLLGAATWVVGAARPTDTQALGFLQACALASLFQATFLLAVTRRHRALLGA